MSVSPLPTTRTRPASPADPTEGVSRQGLQPRRAGADLRTPVRGSADVVRRLAWAAVGVAAGVAAVRLGSPWLLLAWLVPDLGFLAGGWRVLDEHGRLTRRAALGYNVTHTLLGPAALAGAAALVAGPWTGAVAALWLCHIGIDRALGYDLKPVPGRG